MIFIVNPLFQEFLKLMYAGNYNKKYILINTNKTNETILIKQCQINKKNISNIFGQVCT